MKYVALALIGLVLGGCQDSENRRISIVIPNEGSFHEDQVEKQIHEHYRVMENLDKLGWMNPDSEYPKPL